MLRSDILNKLNAPGGENWCSEERFSEKAAYQSLKAAAGFIDLDKANKKIMEFYPVGNINKQSYVWRTWNRTISMRLIIACGI